MKLLFFALVSSLLSIIGYIPAYVHAEKIESIKFIDLSIFDAQLRKALEDNADPIKIEFVDNVKVSQLPTRLQAWLDALQTSGGDLTLTNPETTLEPGAIPLLSLISPIYTIWESRKKEKIPVKFSNSYNLDIVLIERNNDRYIHNIILRKTDGAIK